MDSLYNALTENLQHPLTILLITLGLYLAAEQLFLKTGKRVWLHPVVVSTLLVFLVIRFTPLSLARYQTHSDILKTLLAPFTVALAVPISKQLTHLKKTMGSLILTLIIGGILAGGMGVGLAWLAGGSNEVLWSLTTKGVTTAVTLVMAEQMGTIVPLAVATVVVSGIYGGLVGPPLCHRFGIKDPRVVGFAMGISAHAGGTARAFELNATMGAYASLGMCLNAILTPMVLSILTS